MLRSWPGENARPRRAANATKASRRFFAAIAPKMHSTMTRTAKAPKIRTGNAESITREQHDLRSVAD